jgi:aromatic-L-amino-acid decarboxylase
MNNLDDFTNSGHGLIEWLSEYFKNVDTYPVKPNILPGEIEKQLPESAPLKGEKTEVILNDFREKIFPGITHWQHPGFHAYFPANNSYPSVLAELIMAGLGVQGMKWVTSPSATELEKVVMRWLQIALGLPAEFHGVLMDTASVATLCAILAARERVSGYEINSSGFQDRKLRVYCSAEAHSSIDKAVRIAGIGSNNLVKIDVDDRMQLKADALEKAIEEDLEKGFLPCCIIGALGTTGTCAVDPLDSIGVIARKYAIWYHVDAAYAGTALILPEVRKKMPDFSTADSFVFNPHKWMFTNFDCSAFYVRNPKDLTKTFSLVPAYLQTGHEDEIDFSNWGIQLGRRFRALKLWFVIRSFGIEGIQEKLRSHLELGHVFEQYVLHSQNFELVAPRNLNVVCFRFCKGDPKELDGLNEKLLQKINNTGRIFLSHTLVRGKFVIRFVCGQTNVEKRHIENAWEIINLAAAELK